MIEWHAMCDELRIDRGTLEDQIACELGDFEPSSPEAIRRRRC